MFILFGTKDRAVETDSGNFHCLNYNLKKELVKNSKNQNIQYNYSDFIKFNQRNNINC